MNRRNRGGAHHQCPCGRRFVPQRGEAECRVCTGVYICTRCGEEWSNRHFYRSSAKASGYTGTCKACWEETWGRHVRGVGWKRRKQSAGAA